MGDACLPILYTTSPTVLLIALIELYFDFLNITSMFAEFLNKTTVIYLFCRGADSEQGNSYDEQGILFKSDF